MPTFGPGGTISGAVAPIQLASGSLVSGSTGTINGLPGAGATVTFNAAASPFYVIAAVRGFYNIALTSFINAEGTVTPTANGFMIDIVFLPIILTVARRFGGSVLFYALPAAGAFAAMHALVPPHPGPVAAGTALGGDIGVILLVGLPVAVISWYVGVYLVSKVLGKRFDVPVPDMLFGEVNGGDDRPAAAPPAFGTVLGLLLIPLVLISFNTVLTTLVANGTLEEGQAWVEVLQLLGNTPVALLVSLLAAIVVLGRRNGSFERDHGGPGPGPRPDLLDHPHHRRGRHVRWRAAHQRHRRGADLLAVRPRPAAAAPGLPHRHRAARGPGLGHRRPDHHGRA